MRNPKLYHALKQVTGIPPRIVNEGEPCQLHNVYEEYSFVPRTQELPAACTRGGEQYAVNCPMCGDTRQRLYFSHMWDAEFVQNNVRYHCSDRLFHCFNEECEFSDDEEKVAKKIKFFNALREALGNMVEIPEDAMSVSETFQGNELAQQCTYPADAKDLTDPYTPSTVLNYLRERGFDPAELSARWGVQWLVRYGKFAYPILVIPVKQNYEFWFWQGRLVPTDGHIDGPLERDITTGKVFPKYYFPHGVKKAWALYNLDNARTHDTVFIVEGVTDVWAIGDAAVARFGKTLSRAQKDLLANQCFGKHIIIVPDGDDPQALDGAREDAMSLEITAAFASVKLSILPEGLDPCDMLRTHKQKGELECALKNRALSLSQVRPTTGACGSLETTF